MYENRYCNQEGFSILVCGGKDKKVKVTNEVLELEVPSFKVKKFPSMVEPHHYFHLDTIKSYILAIGDSVELNKSLEQGFPNSFSKLPPFQKFEKKSPP